MTDKRDGKLPKWGEPEGVKQAMKKTPGQSKVEEMVKTMKKSTSDLKREYEKLSGKKAPAGTSDQVLQLRINRLKTQKESIELEEKVMNSDKSGPGKGQPMKSLSRDQHMAAMKHHEQEQMKHDRAGNTKQGNYHADMAKAHRRSTGGSSQSWKEEVELDEAKKMKRPSKAQIAKVMGPTKNIEQAYDAVMKKYKVDKETARTWVLDVYTDAIKGFSEEVEQVDEISKDMKQRYLDKAVPSHYNKFVGREKTTKQQLDKRRAAIQKVSQQLKGKKHFSDFGEEVELDEKLNPSMGAGEYVRDFRDSDAPQFKGKSDKKKQQMAIAAYLDAKNQKEEVELEENMDQYKKITAAQYKKIYDKHKAANAKGGNFGAHRSMTKHPEHGVIHQVYSHKSHNLPSIWKTADGKKHWMKEEVEQVDELKKSTLKSYLQKTANKPSTGKWDKTDKGRMGANRRLDGKFYHKGSKHDPRTGEVIPSKYKAEEVDLEEGVEYHAHGKVFKKKGEAIAHHAKKRGNKSDSYAVHRVDTKTNTITHGFDSQGRSKQLGFNKDKYDRLKAGKSLGEGVDEAKDYNAEIQRHKDIAAKQREKMSSSTTHADMVAAMNRHMKAKKNQKSLTRAQAHMEEVEQVDELKKSTLGSYIKKASDDARNKSNDAIAKHYTGRGYANAAFAQKMADKSAEKRRKGIAMAADKLAREEVELDEVTSPAIKAAYAAAMKTKPGTSERKAAVQKYQKLRLQAIDDNKTRKEEVELDEAKDQYVVMDRKTGKAVTKPMGMQQALDAYDGRGGNAKGLAVVKTTDKRLKEDYSKKSTASLQKTHDKWKDRPMSPADANQLKMIRRELQKRGAMKKEEVELDEASLKMKIAQRGKIESKLRKMKNDDADMAAFLINQDDQKELAKFMKSLDPKSRKAIEAVMNEGTDFAAERAAKANAPSESDREKMRKVAQLLTKERKMRKEEAESVDEAKYGDTGWRKVSGPRKDRYGNTVKNAAKHLARKGMAAAQSDNDKMKKEEVELDEASPRHLKKLVGIARDTNDEDEHNRALGHIEKIAGKKVASQVAKTGKPKSRMLKKGYTSLTPSDRKSSSETGTKQFKKDTLKRLGQHAKAMKGKLPEEVELDEASREAQKQMQQKTKARIKPEHHGKYDFGKIKNANNMYAVLDKAKIMKHLNNEEVEQTNEGRGPRAPSNYAAMMMKKRKKAGTSEFGRHPDKKLSPAQDKHLDVHDDGKIDAKDFKKLRDMKKNK